MAMGDSTQWLLVVFGLTLCRAINGGGAGAYQFNMFVNDEPVSDGGTKTLYNTNEALSIKCRYDITLHLPQMSLEREVNGQPTTLDHVDWNRSFRTVTYEVPPDERTGSAIYRCVASTSSGTFFVSITVSYSRSPPTTPPQKVTPGVTSSSPAPSAGTTFTGLNPLIYTICAVVLLGSLAIVAIITCWVRARRSFNNRSLRSAQTAQDYFDHLSDSEFTPLTSEEFRVSLQQRPPTYRQSEAIENGEQPPPEPPTEPPTRSSPPPEATVSPEEAAIIENLIALNLLPEDHAQRRRLRPPPPPPPARPPPPAPTVMPRPPDEELVASEGVTELRDVGARAQELLTQQRSVGQLISLDTD